MKGKKSMTSKVPGVPQKMGMAPVKPKMPPKGKKGK